MDQHQLYRRARLSEIICEYVNIKEYSARQVYEEIIDVLNAECHGREETSKKALELRDLMLGSRPFDLSSFEN